MLKDITIGQYFPGKSVVHRLDARCKLGLVFLFMVVLFSVQGVAAYSLLALFAVLVVLLSKISLRMIVKSLKSIVFMVFFVSILNLFYTQGTSLFPNVWLFHRITLEGVFMTISMIVRIVLLIVVTSMLSYTTSPIVLTDAIEYILNPFKKIGLPVHELAMMMTIAMRFIPTLIDETGKIIDAQKARGADFESGNLFKRVKALIPILVPLFVSAIRRADDLAIAMESRCYRGGEGRTRFHILKSRLQDKLILFGTLLFYGGVVCVSIFVVLP